MGRAGGAMGWFNERTASDWSGSGWLTRLARDRAGNTLALMAAAMIPMCALTGSAVDMARLYVVKVRLQQACDAGALAGRKFMTNLTASTLDDTATTQAKTFFANNFSSGYMGTPAFTKDTSPYPFTATKTSDNQVAGVASVAVPMTLMKMFGFANQTITVNCQARYDIADTDVMFVLDTTGSMACTPSDPDSCGQSTVAYTRPDGTTGYKVTEKSGSRISALRSAVLSFYDTVAANVDPSTQIRYGFVPYTSTVNAGLALYQLSPSNLVTNWNYQTRHIVGDYKRGDVSTVGTYNTNSATCSAYNNARDPSTGYSSAGAATLYNTSYNSSNGQCTFTKQTVSPNWKYESWPLDVSGYVQTISNNSSVADPTRITGATSKWQGCIEERDTTVASSFDASNLPPDLDPDLPATSTATRWRPMWPEVVYARTSANAVTDQGNMTNPFGDNDATGTSNAYGFANSSANTSNDTMYLSGINAGFTLLKNGSNFSGGYLTCGRAVQRLKVSSRSDISNYVNAGDFVPWGGTYHDTGMIWGVRMLSPTGPFAADTAARTGLNAPNRYIVFMTDGHMSTNQLIYGMWGWENYDKRTTGGNFSNDDAIHNARFLAECQAAKNRNIKVFVVSLASTLDPSLTSCASPNSAYYASDSASLTAAFTAIATQVSRLRISQ